MAKMDWFKLYAEAATDAKLLSLSDSEHRVWFSLLCYASQQEPRGTFQTAKIRLLAVSVARGDSELLRQTLAALEELEIIEIDKTTGEGVFVNWEKRQSRPAYPSNDTEKVNERVKKHREKSRNERYGGSNEACNECNEPVTSCNEACNECNEPVTSCNDIDIERELDTERESPPYNPPSSMGDSPPNTKKPRTVANKPASQEEAEAYIRSKGGSIADGEEFWNHFQANGWRTNQGIVRDWRAAGAQWVARGKKWDAERAARASPVASRGNAPPRNGRPKTMAEFLAEEEEANARLEALGL